MQKTENSLDPNESGSFGTGYEYLRDAGERKMPPWLWVGGGILFLLLCCGAAICFGMISFGGYLEGFISEVSATVEAEIGSTETGHVEDVSPVVTVVIEPENPVMPPLNLENWLYVAEFERTGGWAVGEVTDADGTIEAEGIITGGVFQLVVNEPNGLYWSTPSERFGDGKYQVDITAVAGPLNNGYGLMFFYNEDAGDFYLFEISSDGYVWIGYCGNRCEVEEPLVEDGWFRSNLVREGRNEVNRLTIEVEEGRMGFLINGEEVATAVDQRLSEGDMGLLVETFDEGGVQVHFDNAAYAPLP